MELNCAVMEPSVEEERVIFEYDLDESTRHDATDEKQVNGSKCVYQLDGVHDLLPTTIRAHLQE
jgi:hypothetical protein